VSILIWSTRGVFHETNDDVTSTRCVRRAALERRPVRLVELEGASGIGLWFVKVTLGGDLLDHDRVRAALSDLSVERAFLVSARYGADRAEITYWDEGVDVNIVIEQALALWGSSEVLDSLPGWQVAGLEVLDRVAARKKWETDPGPRVFALGEIVPFE
jgi:hypothetical protein